MIISTQLPQRHLDVISLGCTRSERLIFAEVTFALAPGQALLLTGPNGAGKTTLLMCLAGFLAKSAGTIEWRNQDPERRPGEDIHFVGHQSAVKPGLSVSENLSFWATLNGTRPNDAQSDNVHQALSAAGLEHAIDLDANLLSAGQTRRLAMARLLVTPRPIWLLDEPTAALDKKGEQWVTSLIESHLDQGGITVAATHLDLGLKQSDRIKPLILGGHK